MSSFYDTIARLYEAENQHFTEDLPLYLELAEQTGDPILEVGCGTGRVLFGLAQAGYRVVGVDTSAAMLAIAQRKLARMPQLADHARMVQMDILQFKEGQYPLILLSYNALLNFPEQTLQLSVIKHLAGLLKEAGWLAIDLPNASEAYATDDQPSLVLERTFTEPTSGNLIMQQSVSRLNRAEQKLYISWIYDEIEADGRLKRMIAPQTLRLIFPSELQLMLTLCGLEIAAMYGSYAQESFEEGSERLIVVAKRRS